MLNKNIVKEKSFTFACEVVSLCKTLCDRKEFVLSKQLLRSGTSIGANIREAEQAESRRDFIHKLAIALKEANETAYWLELLFATKYLSDIELESIRLKLIELRLLTKIINTTKNK
jgi:four helix bundle protein